MDMIYADANLEDIGVLQDYSFDECYGTDDNTFECKVQKYNHVCREDYILYVEFTEYGGIIDRIESDTKSGEITYIGRTWHGVLNSFVIEPPKGCIYKVYNGEANAVIRQIISDIGLSSLFTVSTDNSGINIANYKVRYEKAYDVIRDMLFAYQGKLFMYYSNGKVYLNAMLCANFANDEEFDSSQVPFKVGQTYNNVNHLICLGAGEAEKRAVIHLFASDGDNDSVMDIQPYIKLDAVANPTGSPTYNGWYEKSGNLYYRTLDTYVVAGKSYYAIRNPKQDSDYILDKSQQSMFGKNEITEIYDAGNSSIVTNYLPKNDKPNDWNGKYYLEYYERTIDSEGNEKYSLIKQVFKDEYKLITEQPGGWDSVSKVYKEYYFWDSTANPHLYYQDWVNGYWVECDAATAAEKAALGYVIETKSGAFAEVREYTREEHPERLRYDYAGNEAPPDWTVENYTNFFEKTSIEGQYQKVSQQTETWYGRENNYDLYHDVAKIVEPPNWTWAWSTYYTRRQNALQQWEYYAVEGVHHSHFEIIKKKKAPSGWKDNWQNYYYLLLFPIIKNGKMIGYTAVGFFTLTEAVNRGWVTIPKGKTYPTYKKNTFYVLVQDPDTAPAFSSVTGGVFEAFSRVILPPYQSNRYYREVFNEVPDWNDHTYWQKIEDQEQIPVFIPGGYYYAVQDRYKMLAEAGVKRLQELNDTSTLDINLELEQKYDVGDVVGSIDETTGIAVNRTILRKIIKIKKDIVSVEYEVNDYV